VAAAYDLSEEQVRSTAAFRSFRGGDSLDVVELVLAMDDELRGGGFNGHREGQLNAQLVRSFAWSSRLTDSHTEAL
jgi:hypothetical protein